MAKSDYTRALTEQEMKILKDPGAAFDELDDMSSELRGEMVSALAEDPDISPELAGQMVDKMTDSENVFSQSYLKKQAMLTYLVMLGFALGLGFFSGSWWRQMLIEHTSINPDMFPLMPNIIGALVPASFIILLFLWDRSRHKKADRQIEQGKAVVRTFQIEGTILSHDFMADTETGGGPFAILKVGPRSCLWLDGAQLLNSGTDLFMNTSIELAGVEGSGEWIFGYGLGGEIENFVPRETLLPWAKSLEGGIPAHGTVLTYDFDIAVRKTGELEILEKEKKGT